MTIVYYRSNVDNKYYLNKDNKQHLDRDIVCNSCNKKTNKYYIFSKKISVIFENIIQEKYICLECYCFKQKIQNEYSQMDKLK